MNNLQKFKDSINNSSFSDEAKNIMLPIIDSAIERGYITEEEKQKLDEVMGVEIDFNTLVQTENEDSAQMLEGFLGEAEAILQTTGDNLDALDKEFSAQTVPVQQAPNVSPQNPV